MYIYKPVILSSGSEPTLCVQQQKFSVCLFVFNTRISKNRSQCINCCTSYGPPGAACVLWANVRPAHLKVKGYLWTVTRSLVTQYGSTVYIGIAMVYPHWKPYIRILFIFTFNLKLISLLNDIKVKNVWKITSIQKLVVLWCNMYIISEKVISSFCPCFHHHLLLLLLEEA